MAGFTILSLFSGVGGLDLGIKIVWPDARVLGYVERDAYAAGILLARMEDEALERAPVWCGNIQDVDGSELCGRVDIICGGFPCQDISVAGKGVGIGGKRSGLWSEIVRLAGEVRPRYLFLENVSAITARGLDRVLADLAELRFDAEWLCLRAGDVGATHRRERWFCLANAKGYDGRQHFKEWQAKERTAIGGSGEELADTASGDRARVTRSDQRGLSQPDGRADDQLADSRSINGERRALWAEPWNNAAGEFRRNKPLLADATDDNLRRGECGTEAGAGPDRKRRRRSASGGDGTAEQEHKFWGFTLANPVRQGGQQVAGSAHGNEEADARRRAEHDHVLSGDGKAVGAFPPGPGDRAAWERILADHPWLAPATEPGVCVLVDGLAYVVDASRADQLRCCGNGVVPLQAAVALVELLRRSS